MEAAQNKRENTLELLRQEIRAFQGKREFTKSKRKGESYDRKFKNVQE